MNKWFLLFLLFASLSSYAQEIDVLHYKFFIAVNDQNDSIQGDAMIQFVPLTNGATVSLDLASKNKKGKGMLVYSVDVNTKTAVKTTFRQIGERLVVSIPQIKKGDTTSIRILYKGIPADGLIISKNKFSDRTFFTDHWPNRAHHWIPCNDKPADKASFEFLVLAPEHYKVISNGIKLSEKKALPGFTETHWKEEIPLSTKMMAIGVARFATRTFDNSPKNIPVSAWVYPKDSTKGFFDYGLAPEILNFFANQIAPFPYKKLANVQSTTVFGGMENASAIFYAESSITGDRSKEDLLAHEIAHQWFGDMASEKSFAHLWLSEGFANYFTNYYFEKKYGKEAANQRWKDQRTEVLAFAKKSAKPVVDSSEDLMSLLNANSYEKGAWFLHMLRYEVGDEIFQKIVQAYYNQYKGGNSETRDFEAIAEKVSGKELTPFFDQWLYRPGIPQLHISSKVQNNQLMLHLKQQSKPYKFTLEIHITTKDGEVTKKSFDVRKKEETFVVPLKAAYADLAIDPATKLLFELKD